MTKRTLIPVVTCSVAAMTLAIAACGSPTRSSRVTGTGPNPPGQPQVQNSRSKGTPAGNAPAILAVSPASQGAAAGSAGTITTTGVGTVTGAPDTLTIGVGVSTTAPHAAGALSQNNSLAAAVQRALGRDGVAAKDIQTTGLSLQATYPPEATGFQVYDEVTAVIRNLSRAGSIIDDALQPAGDAGRLDMVNLSISDDSPLMAAARQQAVASARSEAEQLATAAGGHLGALVSMSDQSQPQYPVYENAPFASASAGTAAAPPVPIKPGTQQLSVDITAVWSIIP